MKKYAIIGNDYEKTIENKNELTKALKKANFTFDAENPDFVFVLGGDGTFLKAAARYHNLLEKIYFIPFKHGGVGYYTHHNRIEDLSSVINSIKKNQMKTQEYELLEIKFNKKTVMALNELKIVNEIHPIYIDLLIDDEYFETFHGTGIVISTSNGSTGYMKATGGAVILPKNKGIYQIKELVPISTNRYRSLNSPLILSKNNILKLAGEINSHQLIIDTIIYDVNDSEVRVSLSDTKAKVLVVEHQYSEVTMIREIFITDKQKDD